MFKRIFLSILLLAAVSCRAVEFIDGYASGIARVSSIMCHKNDGLGAFQDKVHYAETLNLEKDVYLKEMVRLFSCKTLLGASFFRDVLYSPLTEQSKGILLRRQAIIKGLVDNPEVKSKVEDLLEKIKDEESHIIHAMSNGFMAEFAQDAGFMSFLKKTLPRTHRLTSYAKQNILMRSGNFYYKYLFSLVTSRYIGGLIYNRMSDEGMMGDLKQMWQNTDGYMYPFTLATHAWESFWMYKDALRYRTIAHSLCQLVIAADEIDHLCEKHAIPHAFSLKNVSDKDALEIIKLIQHRRYKKDTSYIFNIPSMYVFFEKMYERQEKLGEIFATVAEIDAYNACATKIVESKRGKKRKFCFVTYNEAALPTINAESFWNMLVDDAVSSSVATDKSIILTGPNAGGKSTSIRALLQNVVLAQTFGIAAAERFELTLFDAIHSYLNISDDILNGLSLFATEVRRAKDILNYAERYKKENKKFYCALDELFTGTGASAGEECAYEFMKKLTAYSGLHCIYATHFEKLKELGSENSYCKNYKVDAPIKNADGKLCYPFTLSAGASTVNVALDMAREANLF